MWFLQTLPRFASFCHYSQFFFISFSVCRDLSVEEPAGCEVVVIAGACNTRFSTREKQNIDRKWELSSRFFMGMESERFSVNGLNLKLAVHWFSSILFSPSFSPPKKKLSKHEWRSRPNGLKFIRRQIGYCEDFLLHIRTHFEELFR